MKKNSQNWGSILLAASNHACMTDKTSLKFINLLFSFPL